MKKVYIVRISAVDDLSGNWLFDRCINVLASNVEAARRHAEKHVKHVNNSERYNKTFRIESVFHIQQEVISLPAGYVSDVILEGGD